MLPRRLLSWILALALLFGQAAAFAHAINHLHPHDATPADPACEVCVAQASLGSAAPPAPFLLPVALHQAVEAPAAVPARAGTVVHCAQARAPPTIV